MFPSFTSLSQRERQRQELLHQAEKELAIERQLDQRYAEAMWAADNESGLIDLSKPTTAQTMTTASTPIPANISRDINVPVPTANQPTSGFINLTDIPVAAASATQSVPDAVPGVFSESDRLRVDSALNTTLDVEEPLSPISTASDQVMAKKRMKQLYEKFPILQTEDLYPEYLGTSSRLKTTFHFGKDMNLHNTRSRKLVPRKLRNDLLQEIDWVKTVDKLEDRLRAKGMLPKNVDTDAAMSGMIRVPGNAPPPVDEAAEAAEALRVWSERAAEVSVRANAENRAAPNTLELQSKNAILSILANNNAALKKISITPMAKADGSAMNESYKLNRNTLELYRDGEALSTKQANKLVSWERTLFKLLTNANDAKIPLEIPAGVPIQYSVPKRSLGDSAVSQSDVQRPRARSDVDSGEIAYESKIKFIFINNSWINDYEVICPVGPDGFVQDFMFAGDGSLVKRESMKPLTAADRASEAYGQIQWEATYHRLIETLNEASRGIANRPANSVNAEMKQMRNDINRTLTALNEQKKSIEGRGLRGAGYINKERKDKDGNLIKYYSNKGYNLAQLEGTGNASALAYKRVGTKFVHLPKLNEHLLKVVYPNRSAVGAQRKISADLAQLIKTLVFDGTIDNQLYESLPLADKRVFHELLRITHTQHALRDPLKDPRDVLKLEYMKLKGELMLGNDNPAMIRELKQVLVDMYSAKLISDDEFKQVLVALV